MQMFWFARAVAVVAVQLAAPSVAEAEAADFKSSLIKESCCNRIR
jgi:hypothetical protein